MEKENGICFSELNKWKDNIEEFNIAGFLLVFGVKIEGIYEIEDSLSELKKICKQELIKGPNDGDTHIMDRLKKFEALKYSDDSDRKEQIQKVILLFNIITMNEANERFCFETFFPKKEDKEEQKKVAFEIEHINPRSDNEDDNDFLWNLSLLWQKHNVYLTNNNFESKYKKIQEKEKEDPILPCTLSVFYKKYSENESKNKPDMTKWTREDGGDKYVEKMFYDIEKFFEDI